MLPAQIRMSKHTAMTLIGRRRSKHEKETISYAFTMTATPSYAFNVSKSPTIPTAIFTQAERRTGKKHGKIKSTLALGFPFHPWYHQPITARIPASYIRAKNRDRICDSLKTSPGPASYLERLRGPRSTSIHRYRPRTFRHCCWHLSSPASTPEQAGTVKRRGSSSELGVENLRLPAPSYQPPQTPSVFPKVGFLHHCCFSSMS